MKQIQKKSQIGRSMTEMLGVLAIIGVLSVVAVSGYRTAITRHKTNNLIEDVKLAGFLVMEGKFANLPVEEEAFIADFTPKTKYEFLAFKESDTTFGIVATHVEENVCHETLTRKVDWLEEIRANGTDKACHDTDDNNISFFFNTALNDTYTPEDEGTCRADRDCPATRPHCRNGYCTKCEEGLELTDGTCTACPQENGAVTNSKKPNLTNTGCHACGNQYVFIGKQCLSCQSMHANAKKVSQTECNRCFNRCYDTNTKLCLASQENNAFINNDGTCNYDCHNGQFFISYSSGNFCSACPALNDSIYMGPSPSINECHKCNMTLFSVNHCIGCSVYSNAAFQASKEECDRCPNRYYNGTQCRLCPTGQKASADGLSCIDE